MGNRITFIIGGARSGKSAYALAGADMCAGKKAFIATAQALDDEMRARIARHKEERGPNWFTLEEPLYIEAPLKAAREGYGAVVLDCLTLWVSNILTGGHDPAQFLQSFGEVLASYESTPLYIVSNEVGMGIVPEYEISRRYRDILGDANKMAARIASRVVFMVAAIPMDIKKAP